MGANLKKYPPEERADGMTPVVEHLSSKHEVLSSNSTTAPPPRAKSLETQSLHCLSPAHYYSTACGRDHSTHWGSLTYDKIL
jgi:hypothetical protein